MENIAEANKAVTRSVNDAWRALSLISPGWLDSGAALCNKMAESIRDVEQHWPSEQTLRKWHGARSAANDLASPKHGSISVLGRMFSSLKTHAEKAKKTLREVAGDLQIELPDDIDADESMRLPQKGDLPELLPEQHRYGAGKVSSETLKGRVAVVHLLNALPQDQVFVAQGYISKARNSISDGLEKLKQDQSPLTSALRRKLSFLMDNPCLEDETWEGFRKQIRDIHEQDGKPLLDALQRGYDKHRPTPREPKRDMKKPRTTTPQATSTLKSHKR